MPVWMILATQLLLNVGLIALIWLQHRQWDRERARLQAGWDKERAERQALMAVALPGYTPPAPSRRDETEDLWERERIRREERSAELDEL